MRARLRLACLFLVWALPHSIAQAAEPVRIGFSIPKTGLFAQAAKSQMNAYQLWRETVNGQGGLDVGDGMRRKIEFVDYDDRSEPAVAARLYEKLIVQDKVDLLLAPWGTQHHLAVVPVIRRYKYPLVGNTAFSTRSVKLKPGSIWFTTPMRPAKLALALIDLLKARNAAKIAVLTNTLKFTSDSSALFKEGLAEAGIEVVLEKDYAPGISDMSGVLTQIASRKPDAVLVFSYPGDAILYLRQARTAGISAKTQFLMLGPAHAAIRKAFATELEGIITVGAWSPKRAGTTGGEAFLEAYKAKFDGAEPDPLEAIEAYVSCQILEQAIAAGGLERGKLADAIRNLTFNTLYGPIKFEGTVNRTTAAGFLQSQNGRLELIWPRAGATAEIIGVGKQTN